MNLAELELEDIKDDWIKKASGFEVSTIMTKYPVFDGKYRTYSLESGVPLRLIRIKKGRRDGLICEFQPMDNIGIAGMIFSSDSTIIDVPLTQVTEKLSNTKQFLMALTGQMEFKIDDSIEVAVDTSQEENETMENVPEWGVFA